MILNNMVCTGIHLLIQFLEKYQFNKLNTILKSGKRVKSEPYDFAYLNNILMLFKVLANFISTTYAQTKVLA